MKDIYLILQKGLLSWKRKTKINTYFVQSCPLVTSIPMINDPELSSSPAELIEPLSVDGVQAVQYGSHCQNCLFALQSFISRSREMPAIVT